MKCTKVAMSMIVFNLVAHSPSEAASLLTIDPAVMNNEIKGFMDFQSLVSLSQTRRLFRPLKSEVADQLMRQRYREAIGILGFQDDIKQFRKAFPMLLSDEEGQFPVEGSPNWRHHDDYDPTGGRLSILLENSNGEPKMMQIHLMNGNIDHCALTWYGTSRVVHPSTVMSINELKNSARCRDILVQAHNGLEFEFDGRMQKKKAVEEIVEASSFDVVPSKMSSLQSVDPAIINNVLKGFLSTRSLLELSQMSRSFRDLKTEVAHRWIKGRYHEAIKILGFQDDIEQFRKSFPVLLEDDQGRFSAPRSPNWRHHVYCELDREFRIAGRVAIQLENSQDEPKKVLQVRLVNGHIDQCELTWLRIPSAVQITFRMPIATIKNAAICRDILVKAHNGLEFDFGGRMHKKKALDVVGGNRGCHYPPPM